MKCLKGCGVPKQVVSNVVSGAKWGLEMRGNEHRSKLPGRPVRPAAPAKTPLNEVVCGAMMLAYERAGKWNEVGPYRSVLPCSQCALPLCFAHQGCLSADVGRVSDRTH